MDAVKGELIGINDAKDPSGSNYRCDDLQHCGAHEIGHEHKHVKDGWTTDAGFVSDVDVKAKLWNPRGKSQDEINERAEYVAQFFDAGRTPEDRAGDEQIKQRYQNAIVINSLMPSGVGIQGVNEEKFAEAVEKNRDNGITLISTSVWAFEGVNDVSFEETIQKTNKVSEEMDLVRVVRAEDIRRAKAEDKMAIMYNSQGADFVEQDLEKVGWAKENGIMVMNFTYNNDNALAGGGQSGANAGVSELGKAFIQKMNREGVIIDCSHSSNQACIDAANLSTKPVLATHSNVKALRNHGRNIDDEVYGLSRAQRAQCAR
ncbi:renal dipeptidase family protein [Vibrio ishigakensis]|uniref:Renal dipeptidase family protein n=1 Tax=Vibrio ishigakensis TaxID=1481914 RepID=A0A0B8PEI1_9VIBR|nr:renal dipeptidase family protein [Vibrio ishigakensis]